MNTLTKTTTRSTTDESLGRITNDVPETIHPECNEIVSEEFGDFSVIVWPVITYHIYAHPVNPGKPKPKRTNPVPGHHIIFQTTPSSKIYKDVKSAAKPPPKLLKKILPAKEALYTVEEAKDEWNRLRGDVWGVYKPKRGGNPFLFWKKRPPKVPEFRVARGVGKTEEVVGKLRNVSTWKKNEFKVGFFPELLMDGKVDEEEEEEKKASTEVDSLDGVVQVTHQSIWRLRSPFDFEIDGRKMRWKGTTTNEPKSKKEMPRWMVRCCHLKLCVDGPFADETFLRDSGRLDSNGEEAKKDNKGKLIQKKPPEVVIARFRRTLGSEKLGRLQIDREAMKGVFGEEQWKGMEKWIFPTLAGVMKIEQTRREKSRGILEAIVDLAEGAGGG